MFAKDKSEMIANIKPHSLNILYLETEGWGIGISLKGGELSLTIERQYVFIKCLYSRGIKLYRNNFFSFLEVVIWEVEHNAG